MFADLSVVVNSLRKDWDASYAQVRAIRDVVEMRREEIIREILATGISTVPLPDGRVLTIRRTAS